MVIAISMMYALAFEPARSIPAPSANGGFSPFESFAAYGAAAKRPTFKSLHGVAYYSPVPKMPFGMFVPRAHTNLDKLVVAT